MKPKEINEIKTRNGVLLEVVDDIDYTEFPFNRIKYYFTPIKDLIFKSKMGTIFKMSDLLPNNSCLVKCDRFNCTTMPYKSRELFSVIAYSAGELCNDYGILSLLHEIGHSKSDGKSGLEVVEKTCATYYALQVLTSSEFLKTVTVHNRALILQEEINAWIWAIRSLRVLREKGINLIPSLNKKRIWGYIYNVKKLKGYELAMNVSLEKEIEGLKQEILS